MGDQDLSQRSNVQEAITAVDATYANWTERDDDLLLLYLHSSLPGGLNDEQFTWIQITNKMNENATEHGINRRYAVLNVRLHYEQYLKPLIITTHNVASISTTRDTELDVLNPAMARSRREHIPFCCRWCHMKQEATARRAREEDNGRSIPTS